MKATQASAMDSRQKMTVFIALFSSNYVEFPLLLNKLPFKCTSKQALNPNFDSLVAALKMFLKHLIN